MTRSYIIVGAGIGGLMAAYRIIDEQPDAEITIIERSLHPGGLLAGIDYPNGLYFDIGTHIFQETGDNNIDFRIQQAVNTEDLIIFEDGRGDISGAYFNGRLQNNTHFPDLRYHKDFEMIFASLNKHLSGKSNILGIDALEPLIKVSTERFGQIATEKIINEIQSTIFKTPAENLAGFCLLLTGISRFIVSDKQKWMNSYTSEPFRSIYGFSEQLELPRQYRHNRKSFYSKKRGSRNFIDGLVSVLKQKGVKFLFGTEIEEFDSARLNFTVSVNQVKSEISASRVVFSNGVIGAAKVCGINLSSVSLDKPLSHTIINLQMAENIDSPLCYFYGMDRDVDFYRITNYRAFSGNDDDKRISVEILGKTSNDIDISDYIEQLYKIGFLTSKSINFSDVIHLPSGFPTPSVKNMNGLYDIANILRNHLPESIIVSGVGSKPGLFFQNDVVKDTYNNDYIMLK
jgi:oxygen-dependent protoporphyrinogen oxidase